MKLKELKEIVDIACDKYPNSSVYIWDEDSHFPRILIKESKHYAFTNDLLLVIDSKQSKPAATEPISRCVK